MIRTVGPGIYFSWDIYGATSALRILMATFPATKMKDVRISAYNAVAFAFDQSKSPETEATVPTRKRSMAECNTKTERHSLSNVARTLYNIYFALVQCRK